MSCVQCDQRHLVRCALSCLGKPYEYGAAIRKNPKKFDCSSFVQYIYGQIGIPCPRSAVEQAHFGRRVSWYTLEVGDLLYFRGSMYHSNSEFPAGIGHVAVYIGGQCVIHASGRAGKVVQTPLWRMWLRRDFVVAKRVLSLVE